MFEERLAQLEEYAKLGGVAKEVVEEMSVPDSVVVIKIRPKIRGKQRPFSLMGVLHCNPHPTGVRPYKGGLRFHPGVTVDLLETLALDMTEKSALTELPFGGAKFGVPFDPKQYQEEELREITEAIAERGVLVGLLDPDQYVPGPDLNTNSKTMFCIYNKIAELNAKVRLPNVAACVTGKPVEYDGCPGREDATARGLAILLNKLLDLLSLAESRPTVAIQGFGNVGMNLAAAMLEEEFSRYRVVAVSDVQGGVYNSEGLNIKDLLEYYQTNKSLAGYPGALAVSNKQVLFLPVDILIPAAIENQITENNAGEVQARMIVEAANEAVTPKAQVILDNRQITFVPGIAANAGGVVVSYIEWSRNRGMRRHTVDINEDRIWVRCELKKIMENMLAAIFSRSLQMKLSLAQSAHALALERIGK